MSNRDSYPTRKLLLLIGLTVALFAIFNFCAVLVYAQEVRAKVTVLLEKLPEKQQEELKDFHITLQNYINNSQWVKEDLGGEINISLQLLLEYIGVSYEDRYKAQLLISNNTDIQYFDKRCRFGYQKNEQLIHDEQNYGSLTGLLDFYIYLILGGEFDKYGKFEGTPYFEKAKRIADLGRFGFGQFVEGWDLRQDLIKKILSEDYKKFREMKDYYFYSLDILGEDRAKARKYSTIAITMIEEILEKDPENKDCKDFLNAHYIEIIDIFKDGEDKSIFSKLSQLDPAHKDIYEKYVQK